MKKQKERPVCEISGGTPPLHSRTAPECRKRQRFAGTVASLAIGLLLFGMVRSAGAADGKVDLLVDGDRFQPSTTLEFRFPEPMVERDLLGIAAPLSEAPVAIEPNLPGAFTWLSRRSGVYVPSAPPELGKTYRVTLRAGLKNASGEPVKAKLDRKLRTPAFQATVIDRDFSDPKDVPPNPEIRLGFNLKVKDDAAFIFESDGGRKIRGVARYANRRDYFHTTGEKDDWVARWEEATGAGADSEEDEDIFDVDDNLPPLKNRLIVEPAKPLTPREFWRLKLPEKIEALTGDGRITGGGKIALGRVLPFVVKSVTPSSQIHTGRSLSVRFSSALAPDVNAESAGKFLRVQPEVPDLFFEDQWETMVIRGSFKRGVEYTLEVDPSLLADSKLAISGKLTWRSTFSPVRPRAYLPAFTRHQLSEGRRKFDVLSVNLKKLRVTALHVDGNSTAEAVEAFKQYKRHWKEVGDSGEPYQALPEGAIRGKVIFDKTYDLKDQEIDAKQTTALNWDEILGGRRVGGVLLTVEGEPLPGVGGKRTAAQALMQLTDLGVLWKHADGKVHVNLFSMQTGEPLKDARVRMLDEGFVATAEATTDPRGEAEVPPGNDPAWMVVSRGEDVHAFRMGPSAGELPMAAFNLPIYYHSWEPRENEAPPVNGLLFSDRPLYRPGETVRVKGIVRLQGKEGQEYFAGRKGTVTLDLPRGRGEVKIPIVTSDRGSFDASFPLDTSTVGRHSLRAEIGENVSFSTSFLVAEFQPNAFEVEVAAPARFGPGDPVKAEVSATYFFGAPIKGGRARWTLQCRPASFWPEGFEDFTFGNDAWGGGKTLTLRGESQLDGTAFVVPRLPAAEGDPQSALLTVEVTDLNQQTVTAKKSFTRDASDFYLGVSLTGKDVYVAGEEIRAAAVAVDPAGKTLEVPMVVEFEWFQVKHRTVRVMGAGEAISFKHETIEESVGSGRGATVVPRRELGKWVIPSGEMTARFKPTRGGQFRLVVRTTDPAGNPVRTTRDVYVASGTDVVWDYRHPSQVDLVPDRESYRVGDTARILVKTPIAGDALVSVERGQRILRRFRVALEGNAPLIEVPIEPADGPNVFVSMMVIRGARDSKRQFKAPEYRYGVCQLKVENPNIGLAVRILPGKAEVEPGEEVKVDISVTGSDGKAAPGAEVTFFAVDDGILALTGYRRPDPQRAFRESFSLNVRTGLTLYSLFPEDPEDLTFGNKGYLIGGGGMHGPGPKLRTNFPGTAVWLPALRTDKNGRVTVKFPAPDALTRYRLVAVACAGPDRFGSAESAVAIRKPLILLSALGQAAHVDDLLIARAVLRNETGADGAAEVSLKLDRTAKPGDGEMIRKFPLANGEVRTVDIPVRLVEPGAAEWVWAAQMKAGDRMFDDGLAARLKVQSPAPVLKEIYLSELKRPENDLLTGVNPQVLEGTGAMSVVLSNTRLASLRGAADDLLTYPYGCTEQRVSSLIPWLTVSALAPVLPDIPQSRAEREKTIRETIQKIFAVQQDSGGLTYWPSRGREDLFVSAWAAVALTLARDQDIDLPSEWPDLLKYLSNSLRGLSAKRSSVHLDDMALAVYALARAGNPEPAYQEFLFGRKDDLTHESRALLALAMLNGKGRGKEVAGLLDTRNPAPEGIGWFGSPSRSLAVRLLAWTHHKPKDPEVGTLVAELLQARRNGSWRTTQENAWALLALSEYFVRVEGKILPVDAVLRLPDKRLPVHLTPEHLTETRTSEFSPASPPGPAVVENPQKRSLYGETRFEVVPPVADQPRQDRGFAVSRRYRKIADDGSLEEAAGLKVGDRVLVTLRVETLKPGHFVAIDDPLPAILEAVNPEFRTQAAGDGEGLTRAWQADYRETRADRVVYFCNHLPAGDATFRYLARVRSAGKVIAPSTKVEEMYRPERFGLSATARLESAHAGAAK